MKAFINGIFNAVQNNLISGGAYYLIARGILTTLLITVGAWLVAMLIGIAVSYLMCYEKKLVSMLGRCLCFIFRSMPVLLVLWLFYYCIFGGGFLSGSIIVALAVGFWGAGYLSEIIERTVRVQRRSISEEITDKLESVFFTAVVPQALEDSLYDLKRLAVHMLQWTTVAGYISVHDLTQVMYGIGQRTMYPFFSIFFSAILYLLAIGLIEWIFYIIGKKLNKEAE